MLKDANFNYFPAVYVVCGYTDMRYGIDSLAAIIERKYKVNLFIPNTLSFSAEDPLPGSKDFFGKATVFFSFASESNRGISSGQGTVMNSVSFAPNSSSG